MNGLSNWVERHPASSFLVLIAIFGIGGILDQKSEERATAKISAPSPAMQLKNICSQPWPDIEGAVEARAHVCPKE